MYKLCYVSDGVLYFTNKELSVQWGDDWNDHPYEHNAGEPYSDSPEQIKKFMFYGNFAMPHEKYQYNSPYSVQEINQKVVPWLWKIQGWDNLPNIYIFAGDSISTVMRKIINGGGGGFFFPASFFKDDDLTKLMEELE